MAGHADSRGHALCTTSKAAAEAFDKGMHSFNCWRADAMRHLDDAIAADDDFALAKLTKAWILHMARSDSFKPKIEALMAAAEPVIDASDSRERHYYDSLLAASRGRTIEAATIMEAMLIRHPTDLLAHRLVQFEIFWNGRAAWMREIAERAAPHWKEDMADYGCFLSVRSFSNEEFGDYALAERCGRQAIEIDPSDCWGAHAIAHVQVMQGKIDEGIAWLEGLSDNWAAANQMRHHLWWHLSLLLLERGEHERILELLTTQIRNPESPLVQAMPDATIDIQNVAALLMRLELRGVDVGDRWSVLADICAGRVHNHANPFSNAHDMMVLAATGQDDRCDELLASVRDFAAAAEGTLGTTYNTAGIAVCEAMLAHRKGDYGRVIELMSPIRHDLPLLGGSHAQRDVFYQILIDAAQREGRTDLIPLYLSDVARIGFDAVNERTLYREAAAVAA